MYFVEIKGYLVYNKNRLCQGKSIFCLLKGIIGYSSMDRKARDGIIM